MNYCCNECKYEDHRVECECKECGCTFQVTQSRYDNGRKYCSTNCRDESQKDTIERKCNYCGEGFELVRYKIETLGIEYCSNKCRGLDERERIECKCDYCGSEFEHTKSHIEQGKGKYCSNKCHGLDKRKENPDIRESSEYIEWREDVLQRDNCECQDCGSEEDLHVHHITPISEDKEKATDMDNGVTVCVECHAERHRERGDDVVSNLLESFV